MGWLALRRCRLTEFGPQGPISNPPYGVNSVRTFRTAHDRASLLPNNQERAFRTGVIGRDNSETAVLIPQIVSALLALAFSAFFLVAGHFFIQRKTETHDVMYLQNLMHLPPMR